MSKKSLIGTYVCEHSDLFHYKILQISVYMDIFSNEEPFSVLSGLYMPDSSILGFER